MPHSHSHSRSQSQFYKSVLESNKFILSWIDSIYTSSFVKSTLLQCFPIEFNIYAGNDDAVIEQLGDLFKTKGINGYFGYIHDNLSDNIPTTRNTVFSDDLEEVTKWQQDIRWKNYSRYGYPDMEPTKSKSIDNADFVDLKSKSTMKTNTLVTVNVQSYLSNTIMSYGSVKIIEYIFDKLDSYRKQNQASFVFCTGQFKMRDYFCINLDKLVENAYYNNDINSLLIKAIHELDIKISYSSLCGLIEYDNPALFKLIHEYIQNNEKSCVNNFNICDRLSISTSNKLCNFIRYKPELMFIDVIKIMNNVVMEHIDIKNDKLLDRIFTILNDTDIKQIIEVLESHQTLKSHIYISVISCMYTNDHLINAKRMNFIKKIKNNGIHFEDCTAKNYYIYSEDIIDLQMYYLTHDITCFNDIWNCNVDLRDINCILFHCNISENIWIAPKVLPNYITLIAYIKHGNMEMIKYLLENYKNNILEGIDTKRYYHYDNCLRAFGQNSINISNYKGTIIDCTVQLIIQQKYKKCEKYRTLVKILNMLLKEGYAVDEEIINSLVSNKCYDILDILISENKRFKMNCLDALASKQHTYIRNRLLKSKCCYVLTEEFHKNLWHDNDQLHNIYSNNQMTADDRFSNFHKKSVNTYNIMYMNKKNYLIKYPSFMYENIIHCI
jgi:hypothetical protein